MFECLIIFSSQFWHSIYPLFGSFGVLIERGDLDDLNFFYFVSWIELDFYGVTCTKLQTLEYRCFGVRVLVDKFDATDFVLQLETNEEYVAQICKVVEKSILVGDPIQLPCHFESYFGGFLYDIYCPNGESDNWMQVCLLYL
jgi:hypothetical protein